MLFEHNYNLKIIEKGPYLLNDNTWEIIATENYHFVNAFIH